MCFLAAASLLLIISMLAGRWLGQCCFLPRRKWLVAQCRISERGCFSWRCVCVCTHSRVHAKANSLCKQRRHGVLHVSLMLCSCGLFPCSVWFLVRPFIFIQQAGVGWGVGFWLWLSFPLTSNLLPRLFSLFERWGCLTSILLGWVRLPTGTRSYHRYLVASRFCLLCSAGDSDSLEAALIPSKQSQANQAKPQRVEGNPALALHPSSLLSSPLAR